MATNRIRKDGTKLALAATNPTTPASGGPLRVGPLTGVALTDEGEGGNAATGTSIDFGMSVWDVVVDDDAGTGIAVYDLIYYHDTATGSPATNLNNVATSNDGFFGVALEVVSTNATTRINVLHIPLLIAVALANNSVGAAQLTATLRTGFVDVPLTGIREVASNNLQNIAANGGLLATDTTPILEFTNGDTDSAWRMRWAASNSDAITFQCAIPPDLNEAAAVEVHLIAAMGGATDTPVIAADTFFNVGDTKVEDDSAAITGTTATEYVITVAAADVPAGAQTMSVELTPGAHTTDTLLIYAVWIEYTRM